MEFAAPVFQSWGREMEQKNELPAGISQSSPKVKCFLREFSLDMSSGRSPPKSAPGNGETPTFFGKVASPATKMLERAFISKGFRAFRVVVSSVAFPSRILRRFVLFAWRFRGGQKPPRENSESRINP